MAELTTIHGILALVDIVNFTPQSVNVGEKFTPRYLEYFQEKINSIAKKNRFHVIKYMGDGALIFGTGPDNLLEIMLDLFDRDKLENRFGFMSRFRIVAHSGYFQFQMKNRQPVDLMNAEGIKVFRMEKYAGPWELMVTRELYQGIKSLLTSQNIEAGRMTIKKPLKGFDSEQWYPPFYKLTLAEKQTGAANLLEQRMDQLEQDVRFILVFGNLYDPVPMDKNFINLSILCDKDKETRYTREESPGYDRGPAKLSGRKRGKGKPGEDDWIFIDKMEREHPRDFNEIDVNTLYTNKHKRYTNGVIFGLPGAGKTTILRHLAHKEFKANRRRKPHRQKIILFVPCRDIPFYDTWHQDQYGEGEVVPDMNTALEYMTWVFLFGTRTADVITGEELVEFHNAAQKVKQAFKENRLTLLVDALDEAPGKESKERIKELFLLLASKNRLFLTSRPSERIHLRQQKVPVFNVLSLTMDQVREVARHLMDENSFIYKQFDDAIWKEEIVVKMAATPITALLVTAYFQAYGQFHHRFPMYDLLMKFILVKVWEHIKTDSFPYKNLELFFEEVKKKGFFEKFMDAGAIYDGLGSLCYGLFFKGSGGKVHRMVNETTLKEHFKEVVAERFHYEGNRLEVFVEQWIERFQQDHLLLRAGADEYVFIHSTIMEYLDYRDFNNGDSQLVDLREQLLYGLVQKEPVDRWLTAGKEVMEENLLQLDTKDYHPEDRNFKYYQEAVGKELVGFFGSPNMKHSGPVRWCVFSPDGKTFVSASEDDTLKLWDAASGKEMRTFIGHKDAVWGCAFSPDGTRLISSSFDQTLKLWDAASSKEMKTFSGHKDFVYNCAFLFLPWKLYDVTFSPALSHMAATANINGTLILLDFKEYMY